MKINRATYGAHTQSLLRAADYVKRKYSVPDEEILSPYMEREYNCRFVIAADSDPMFPIWELEFDHAEDLTAFLLKWSSDD